MLAWDRRRLTHSPGCAVASALALGLGVESAPGLLCLRLGLEAM